MGRYIIDVSPRNIEKIRDTLEIEESETNIDEVISTLLSLYDLGLIDFESNL